MKTTLTAALAFGLLLPLSSCVTWRQYEVTLIRADKYEALAKLRRDSIEAQRMAWAGTYRDNERLNQKVQLLNNELSSTRTQYTQLQVANTDVLTRYDRYLSQAALEMNTNSSEVLRLSQAATRREIQAYEAERQVSQLNALLAAQRQGAITSETSEAGVAGTPGQPLASQLQSAAPPAERERARSQNVYRAMQSSIVGFTGREASVVRQLDFVVVRLSEHLLFPDGQARVSSLGLLALRQIASALSGDRFMQAIVYAQSRREGTPSQLQLTNGAQAEAVGEALVMHGAHPGQVAVDRSAVSAARIESAGALGSSLDGEIVLVIRERDFRAGAGMFGAN